MGPIVALTGIVVLLAGLRGETQQDYGFISTYAAWIMFVGVILIIIGVLLWIGVFGNIVDTIKWVLKSSKKVGWDNDKGRKDNAAGLSWVEIGVLEETEPHDDPH